MSAWMDEENIVGVSELRGLSQYILEGLIV
jgi:hypothetical protein